MFGVAAECQRAGCVVRCGNTWANQVCCSQPSRARALWQTSWSAQRVRRGARRNPSFKPCLIWRPGGSECWKSAGRPCLWRYLFVGYLIPGVSVCRDKHPEAAPRWSGSRGHSAAQAAWCHSTRERLASDGSTCAKPNYHVFGKLGWSQERRPLHAMPGADHLA
mgnify:CR=1 FL=1